MTRKSLALVILKRFLDALIVFYLALIPVILITGGVKVDLADITIQATRVRTPLQYLILFGLVRLFISTELKNALLVLGSLVFTLFTAEIAIRIWDAPIAKPRWIHLHKASPTLGWELVPGATGMGKLGEHYQISAFGLRDREYQLDKPPDISRIAAIGDSFTFGMGVNLEDAYPKQLERILRAQGMQAEVMNFGVIAHSMWQHNAMLKTRVLQYQPDLIVLGLFTGDLHASVPPYTTSPDYRGKNPFEKEGVKGLLSRSALRNFLKHANALFEYKYRYRRESYMRSIPDRKKTFIETNNMMYKIMSGSLEEEKLRQIHKALKDFVALAKNADAEVLIVYIPDSVQLNEPRLQMSNRFVANICRETGVAFVDATLALEAEGHVQDLYLFPFDAHNNPRGHELIAQAAARRILSVGLLAGNH
jgi:lysophospholipase L1-like esterase